MFDSLDILNPSSSSIPNPLKPAFNDAVTALNTTHTMSTEPTSNAPSPKEPEKAPATTPVEQAAQPAPAKPKEEFTDDDLKALPLRQYLEHTVVGVIMQGMQQICRKRPDDPVAYMADFLIRNNPKKRKAEDAAGGAGEDAPAPAEVKSKPEGDTKPEAPAAAAPEE